MLVSVPVMVTAPVELSIEILLPATIEVTPAFVRVTAPDVPPPERPVPAVTEVMSPTSVVKPCAAM